MIHNDVMQHTKLCITIQIYVFDFDEKKNILNEWFKG